MNVQRENAAGLNWSLTAILCVALAGCSLTRSRPASKPERPSSTSTVPSGSAVPQPPPDVLSIPDAVPRAEPRGTRGNPPFYEVFGKRYYVLASSEGFVERGTASWYGPGFHSASTSLGERYDMYAMTAAHKTLPIPAYAEVTNLRNGRKVVVRINDRGPFVGDRIIDLSYTAAAKLDKPLNSYPSGFGVKFDDKFQNTRAIFTVIQWQGGKQVTVFPAEARGSGVALKNTPRKQT